MATLPELSVVMARAGDDMSFVDSLVALGNGCKGVETELIVVDTGNTGITATESKTFAHIRIEAAPAGALTPVQWGIGARVARGRVVAFTTDHMRVGEGWGRAFVDAVHGQTVGVGGPIALVAGADGATTAAYFLRFSAFAPSRMRDGSWTADIAGDNAAYSREAILRHADLLAEGFWEVEFHRRFAGDDLELRQSIGATATLVGPVPFGAMMRQRFEHGTEFGVTRVRRRGEAALKLIASSPLVPAVMLVRTGRRAMGSPGDMIRFLKGVPWLTLLASSWALGEANGAWRALRGTNTAP